MSMYNLLEHSGSYSMTSGTLWNLYRDEVDNVNHDASYNKSSKYKSIITAKQK